MKLLDIYLGSAELKKKIVQRSLEFQIPLAYICREIGIEYKTFMSSYINVSGPSSLEVTEEQFEKMLSILGISVRHQFIIMSDYNGKAISDTLSEKYEKIKRDKNVTSNKKRNITGAE